jgi:hypothetical protein
MNDLVVRHPKRSSSLRGEGRSRILRPKNHLLQRSSMLYRGGQWGCLTVNDDEANY